MTDKQLDLLATRCCFCEELAENEFLPLFCHLCLGGNQTLLAVSSKYLLIRT